MALQVASMLDEVAFKKEWLDTISTTLNNALLSIKVSPGYSILVSLANRNYLLESGDSTRLSISIVPEQAVAKCLLRAKARVIVHPDALKEVEDMGDEWNDVMLEKRKLQIQGDQVMFNKLHTELQSHILSLQTKVEAAGPGVGNLMRAIDVHNESIGETSQELALSQLSTQIAHLTADAAELQPLLSRLTGWILFSAMSSLQGNMGQANYVAANMILDAHTFSMRTTNGDNFLPVTLMWGAIGNLGMRLKAFGSQDSLALQENTNDILMTPMEAKDCLTHIVNGDAPEWVAAWKNTKEYNQYALLDWTPLGGRPAWGGKGKGGGLSFAKSDSSDAVPSFHSSNGDSTEAPEQGYLKHAHSWLFPGRRVRTQGLVLNAELNGVKGTLVEETEPGVWAVLLDAGFGEKRLKAHNLTTLSGAPVEEGRSAGPGTPSIFKPTAPDVKASVAKKMAASSISITGNRQLDPVQTQPAVDFLCIAGTWDDWTPQDMLWNARQECHSVDVMLTGASDMKFGVNRGKAGPKKWAVRPKQWNMGNVVGSYRINVFMKNRQVQKVEWEKLA